MVIDMAKDAMNHSIEHLKKELAKIRAGKAHGSMLDGIFVDYYGTSTPLAQVSNINTPDARTITVQPWEKKMIDPIERAIHQANLGINPQNNGDIIIISIPPLTEERRRTLVKQSKNEGENAKVSIRNSRKEANDEIKNLSKSGLSDDEAKAGEERIQKLTNDFTTRVDELMALKEKDIMTV